MIISHTHKYIFIKPTKVAGTSVEVNLAKHCGVSDIITPITKHDSSVDKLNYCHAYNSDPCFYNHISPANIQRHISKDIWNSYTKITIIRNPWDLCVSRYWWDVREKSISDRALSLKNWRAILDSLHEPMLFTDAWKLLIWKIHSPKPPTDFLFFMKHFPKVYTNTRYYLDNNKKRICDHYLRYESLETDYEKLCHKLQIPYEALPYLKSRSRSDTRHFSKQHTQETARIVEELFKNEIEEFHYSL